MGQQTTTGNSYNNTSGTTSSTGTTANSGTTANLTGPGYAPQASALQSIFGALGNATGTSGSWLPQQQTLASNENAAGTNLAGTGTALATGGANTASIGSEGALGALGALLGYNPSATNNAGGVNNFASQYVQNSNIPAQVAQAESGATQNLAETTLPGITQGMAGTGNINSSRTGLAQGLAQSNLANTVANMTNADIGAAYGTGAGIGEGALQSNNQLNEGALSSALYGGTGLGTSGALQSTEGTNNAATGYGLSTTGLNYGANSPFQSLMDEYGIAGANNWGTAQNGTTTNNGTTSANGTSNQVGYGTQSTTTNPSALTMIGSILGML
jgi:hypothetical protein